MHQSIEVVLLNETVGTLKLMGKDTFTDVLATKIREIPFSKAGLLYESRPFPFVSLADLF